MYFSRSFSMSFIPSSYYIIFENSSSVFLIAFSLTPCKPKNSVEGIALTLLYFPTGSFYWRYSIFCLKFCFLFSLFFFSSSLNLFDKISSHSVALSCAFLVSSCKKLIPPPVSTILQI